MKSDKAGSDSQMEAMTMTIQMIAPMMPHLAEECWSVLGKTGLISATPWPVLDESLLQESAITLPVQINGKKRGDITIGVDDDKSTIEKLVLEQAFVQQALSGTQPKKVVVVPGRIVNVVI